MNETSPVAIADGIALMIWVLGGGGSLFLIVAAILQYFFEPRDRRGEFEHQAKVARASQQLVSDVDLQLAAELDARRELASNLHAAKYGMPVAP